MFENVNKELSFAAMRVNGGDHTGELYEKKQDELSSGGSGALPLFDLVATGFPAIIPGDGWSIDSNERAEELLALIKKGPFRYKVQFTLDGFTVDVVGTTTGFVIETVGEGHATGIVPVGSAFLFTNLGVGFNDNGGKYIFFGTNILQI